MKVCDMCKSEKEVQERKVELCNECHTGIHKIKAKKNGGFLSGLKNIKIDTEKMGQWMSGEESTKPKSTKRSGKSIDNEERKDPFESTQKW